MKFYRCDKCGTEEPRSEPTVSLTGATGTSGGILLPERFHVKTFCSVECFWKWINLYCPEEFQKKKK